MVPAGQRSWQASDIPARRPRHPAERGNWHTSSTNVTPSSKSPDHSATGRPGTDSPGKKPYLFYTFHVRTQITFASTGLHPSGGAETAHRELALAKPPSGITASTCGPVGALMGEVPGLSPTIRARGNGQRQKMAATAPPKAAAVHHPGRNHAAALPCGTTSGL